MGKEISLVDKNILLSKFRNYEVVFNVLRGDLDWVETFEELVYYFSKDKIDTIIKEVKESNSQANGFAISLDEAKFNYANISIDFLRVEQTQRGKTSSKNIKVINFNKVMEICINIFQYHAGNAINNLGKVNITTSNCDEYNALFRCMYEYIKNKVGCKELIWYIPDTVFWTVTPSLGTVAYAIIRDCLIYADGIVFNNSDGKKNIVADKAASNLNVQIKLNNFLVETGMDKVRIKILGILVRKYSGLLKPNEMIQFHLDLVKIEDPLEFHLKKESSDMNTIEEVIIEKMVDTYIAWYQESNREPDALKILNKDLRIIKLVNTMLPTEEGNILEADKIKEIENFIKPKELVFGLQSFVKWLSLHQDLSLEYMKYLEDKDQDAKTIEETVKNFDRIFMERIIGQEQVIKPIWDVLKKWFIGIRSKKPIGSFLMVGPTGVGKTETAKLLAEKTFDNLIVLDMSEYQSEIDKTKIIGVAPGYSGYDQGAGVLDKVAANPRSVILFDEIEKAHPLIFDLLLQLLDEGRLTDHKGNEVSFRECLVICTTNAHYSEIEHLGNHTRSHMINILTKTFRKEFLARFNDVIKYNHLSSEVMEVIFDKKMVEELKEINENQQIEIKIIEDENYYQKKIRLVGAMDRSLGARELSRMINQEIVAPLIEMVIDLGTDIEGKEFYFDTVGNLKYK